MGIEPTYQAWEARVLPLNYTRVSFVTEAESWMRWLDCQSRSYFISRLVRNMMLVAKSRFGSYCS
jgi:hypothetical protein